MKALDGIVDKAENGTNQQVWGRGGVVDRKDEAPGESNGGLYQERTHTNGGQIEGGRYGDS